MKKWVVNPITAKRNTLTAFSPSPFGEGRGEASGVRLLGLGFWPVHKTYAY